MGLGRLLEYAQSYYDPATFPEGETKRALFPGRKQKQKKKKRQLEVAGSKQQGAEKQGAEKRSNLGPIERKKKKKSRKA